MTVASLLLDLFSISGCKRLGFALMTARVPVCRLSGQRRDGRCTAQLRTQMDAASAQWWHQNRISAPEMPKAANSASSWREYAHALLAHIYAIMAFCSGTFYCKNILNPCINPLRDCSRSIWLFFHFCHGWQLTPWKGLCLPLEN